MTSTDHQPTNRPHPKIAVAAVTIGVVLLIVLAGLLLQQRSRNRALQEQLHAARDRLEQHGAIELTDPRRLHVRWLPTSRRQEELGCRIHVPANQSYRLIIHVGPIPADGGLPEENSGKQVPVDLPAHDADREITALGGLQFNHRQDTWEIACRILDPTEIDYPVNGMTVFVPPAFQRFFTVQQATREFQPHFDREKTFVFEEGADHFRLATATIYEHPLDAEGNVDFGDSSLGEWLASRAGTPATGFLFWIEKASSEMSD